MHADVHCDSLAEARRLLRREPPFRALRLNSLRADLRDAADEASLLGLIEDAASHESLRRFRAIWHRALEPFALHALVDAALRRRWTAVDMCAAQLTPASVPALERLVSGGALKALAITGNDCPLLDVPTAVALGRALQTSRTLTRLLLTEVGLWRDVQAATMLLTALVAHPTLHTLDVSNNGVGAHGAFAGAVFAALLAADAPSLQALFVGKCDLGDAGMAPLLAATAMNTHLQELAIVGNGMSAALARRALVPAVRACRTLVVLLTDVGRGVAWRGGSATVGSATRQAVSRKRCVLKLSAPRPRII